MNVGNFISKLQNVTNNYKTVYMWGVFGSPVKEDIIIQKTNQYPSWYTVDRQALFRSLIGKGYFAFDCVNLIKAILWGWNGDIAQSYGGAKYASNGVPDISADVMINKCKNISTNFSNIAVGEAVWMPGHIGTYIGNGKVIECTPAWNNGVQITTCLNTGAIKGLSGHRWVKHGKLPYITYEDGNINMDNKNIPDIWAKEDWDWAKGEGWLDGTRPKDNLTRQEFAIVIRRLVERFR